MAAKGLQGLSKSLGSLRLYSGSRDPLTQCLAPSLTRSMATEAPLPSSHTQQYDPVTMNDKAATEPFYTPPKVLATIYKFPTMEPLRFHEYSSKYLNLPMRRDILHRAVVFEGDSARQGTASSKTRFTVRGSHRKIRPQKGTGSARLGTRQSPMLRGGGKSFGPHPRDFATELPRKMYDLAWRTALSHRYKKGELIICENGMDLEYPEQLLKSSLHKKLVPLYAEEMMKHNHWGKQDGRSLLITEHYRENLFTAMEQVGKQGTIELAHEVDVKDLLTLKRVIIEKSALDSILRSHQSDLIPKVRALA
ncbi:hypothetical protein HYALB_00007941 [Hymenoscyphus albidus]|uniref:Large ribosomal subunit protein uL4m n=1 Tax=Hymenoscyphus albidus TaxID=595503 RepID=A0A9N9LQA8_9HELO|nr:hypothetical protein HYALB_00007941 [Hymenoscyphus albidus]